ncbi:hypothetical protein BKA66DRAFT_586918 [Pyrenochaeta sp. MPI-SDFR-AT-0127]|nr:hypothetical protein BKA66DRAFT_586918 [Pyrenochaeta sp. MPI-SDFR-AT-0127]
MNPYETNPEKISPTDWYADVPFYGRYFPRPTDFTPDEKHINCTTPDSLEYWSTVNGRDVFVQERIPEVGLNIAWQYVSQSQKTSFKQQIREVLRKLCTTISPAEISRRSYVVTDPDPFEHRGIQELERDVIFAADNKDDDFSFMHNDISLSNCIVDNDRIVGLIDWEMAGFFGWKTAANIHVQIRTPKRENFVSLNLPEEMLNDILFWNDLYDVEY